MQKELERSEFKFSFASVTHKMYFFWLSISSSVKWENVLILPIFSSSFPPSPPFSILCWVQEAEYMNCINRFHGSEFWLGSANEELAGDRVGGLGISFHCRLHLQQQFLPVLVNALFLGLGHWAITVHWFPVVSSPRVLYLWVSTNTAHSSVKSPLVSFLQIPVWLCHLFLSTEATIIFASC